MRLFEENEICITGIRAIERYRAHSTEPVTRRYPPRLPTYELIYFIKGSNLVRFGDRTHIDEADSIRFLPKESDAACYVLEESGPSECIDFYFECTSPLPREMIGLQDMSELYPFFERAERVWRSRRTGYYAEAMSLLYEIVRCLQIKSEAYLTSEQSSKLAPAHDYLIQHFADFQFDYAAMCDTTSLSYDYFKELFKRRYGLPPVKYLTAYRMERAKELLIAGRLSIAEIAEQVGYVSVYYFSTVFKKHLGVSPRAWRKRG